MKQILGIDCGNTIFHYLTGKPIAGAIENIAYIVRSGHFDEVYLISKIDPVSEYLYLLNLRRIDFWQKTGMKRENIRFCRRHHEKAAICEALGITHFIDDRLEVLTALDRVPHRYAFKPKFGEMIKHTEVIPHVQIVRSWPLLREQLVTGD